MMTLRNLFKKKTQIAPKILVVDEEEELGLTTTNQNTDRTYVNSWRARPESRTGREYRVIVVGEYGSTEGYGETPREARQDADKNYDREFKKRRK